ncbi:MAG: FliA/WhiG family RNA polymerase sigma factor [Planctomycetota bacterium]
MNYADEAYAAGTMNDEERNALVVDYLPLVRHVIGRLPVTPPSFMDLDDLFEVGVLGLMNAARTFNPNRGAQFKTHAYVAIRGAVLDELRRYDVLPRSRRDRIKHFHRTTEELEEVLGRTPTPEELAEAMALTVEQVEDVLVNMHGAAVLSLQEGESDEDGSSRLEDCLRCMRTATPDDIVERGELLEQLKEEIAKLPEKERHMIVLYYGEGLLLKEIGEVLGVTESRVSQIHSRAVFRLNKALGAADRTGA